MSSDNLPINHRKKWSINENNQLLNEIKNKIPYFKIADIHKRTIGAIKYKLIRNVINDMEVMRICNLNFNYHDPPIQYLSEITNLTVDDLLNGFAKLKFDYNPFIVNFEDNNCNEVVENKVIKIGLTYLFSILLFIAMIYFYNLFNVTSDGLVLDQ